MCSDIQKRNRFCNKLGEIEAVAEGYNSLYFRMSQTCSLKFGSFVFADYKKAIVLFLISS
jgi:hypothetical protein